MATKWYFLKAHNEASQKVVFRVHIERRLKGLYYRQTDRQKTHIRAVIYIVMGLEKLHYRQEEIGLTWLNCRSA